MNEAHLYAGAIVAMKRINGEFAAGFSPIVVLAGDKKFALAQAHVLCLQQFPIEQGYSGHTEDVIAVPEELIQAALT